jgi:hypothetical protein
MGFIAQNTTLGENGNGSDRFAAFDVTSQQSGVPEPGTMVLFGIGALALGLIPRLRKNR